MRILANGVQGLQVVFDLTVQRVLVPLTIAAALFGGALICSQILALGGF